MGENYQVVVAGAGAAGMMAAGRAAELGARVLLLEKTHRPGQKILISGNGRCNLTNAMELESFIGQFGVNGKFLYNAFHRFFRNDLVVLMERFDVPCRTGSTGKVYPKSDNARDVVRGFTKYLEAGNVTIQYNTGVTGFIQKNNRIIAVETNQGIFKAGAVVIAAGGASHPQTGSDGNGYTLAQSLGHTIVKTRPALVPLVVKETDRAKELQASSLRKVRLTAFQCPADKINISLTPKTDVGERLGGKKPKAPVIESRTGDAIITHFGLSGPVTLEMSLAIVDALENGPVSVSYDLQPDKDIAALKTTLQQAFERHSAQLCRNALKRFTSPKVIGYFLQAAGIPEERLCRQVTASERDALAALMKSLRFNVVRPYSMETAMVTAGGIALDEIDPRTMASKRAEGLYFCGEILDLDAGTGGFNLQAAFSTGWVAGESAAEQALK